MIVATVFGKIISIFIIMIVGVICCKMGIIDDYTKQRLSRLSTLVVNPILIFTSFQMEYDSELLKKMGLLFVLAVISYLISIVIGHFLLHEREGYDLSIEKFAVTYDNCGFIGVPLGYALFGNKDETYKFFLSYVNEYVDFYNKTTEFSSDEFTESLDYIGKMIRNDNSRKEGTTWDIIGNYLFRTSQLSFDGSMMSTLNSYFYIYNNNSTPVIIPNYNKKANAVSAFVQCGIALNNNSNNKEKALAFIQYVLSYDIQKLWSESSSSSSIVVRALPVNKAAFEYVIDHTSKRVYDINDDGEYEKSEEEYSDEIKTKFFNEYLDMINSISSCTLYDYLEFENTYYNSSVIGDIVNDYLSGDISKEKFIRQLSAATEIYLTE